MLYRHVLVTTDLCNATPTLDVRVRAFQQAGAMTSLAYVMGESLPSIMAECALPMDEQTRQMLTDQQRDQLLQLGERLNIPPAQQHLLAGQVSEQVAQLACRIDADLMLLTNRSHTTLGALLFSQMPYILSQAPCDVLVVPQNQEDG